MRWRAYGGWIMHQVTLQIKVIVGVLVLSFVYCAGTAQHNAANEDANI